MPAAVVLGRMPLRVVGCNRYVDLAKASRRRKLRDPCREPGRGSVHPVEAASGAVPTKETIMRELQGIVRFTFHADKVDEFKRLSAECLEIVRTKDVGTLQYDTYFNDDESECIVLERFTDSGALILHGQNMAPLMESIMATGTVSGELLGDLSEGLRATMAGSPVGLFTLYQAL
jgi:quinol monooxygenase YgiN